MSEDDTPSSPGQTWRMLAWIGLVFAPVGLAAGLVHRAELNWAYCLAAAEGSAKLHPTPGLFTAEALGAMVHPSWALTLVIVLAFAGVSSLTILPGRARLGLLGWVGLAAGLIWILHDPAALHTCDRTGIEGESRLLFLVPAGWGYTFAVALATRRSRRA